MRFIEIKVINCIDPQNCSINYLDPVLLEYTRPGDAKHKINFPLPYTGIENILVLEIALKLIHNVDVLRPEDQHYFPFINSWRLWIISRNFLVYFHDIIFVRMEMKAS